MFEVNEVPVPQAFVVAPPEPPSEPPSTLLPREKLDALGASALTDAELLALFFGTGTKGLNVIDMSRLLLARHGSLVQLSRLGWKDLATVPGIGEAKAKHLAAAFELGKRLARETYRNTPLDDPQRIYDFIGPEMRALPHEVVRVILLNARMRFTHMEDISHGSLNEASARPADILRPAMLHRAFAFILIHNHPTGDSNPSEADRKLTRRLQQAADLMGIRFADHVIVGQPAHPQDRGWFSFRANGMV